MTNRIEIPEKYHDFQRGGVTCRFGIYGLSWDYFHGSNIPNPADLVISLTIPVPTIRVIQAVVTSLCNLNCTYCSFFANTPAPPRQMMSEDDLQGCVQYFNQQIDPGGTLLITGGEPELNPKAVNYLCENVIGTKILFTNGTLTTKARLRYYQDHDVNLIFSLDGDLFAQDAVRREVEGSFEKVARSLKQARSLKTSFGISAVVGDHNIDRLPELVRNIHKEYGPQSIGLNLPHAYGKHRWLRIAEYTAAMLEIFDYAKKAGLFVDQINRRLSALVDGKFRFRDCSAQGEKIIVYPGGARSSCVNEGALPGRNLDWGSRLPLLSTQCQNCFAIGLCGGGCIFDGEVMYGSGCFDERNCYFTKRMLEYMLWDFYDTLGSKANDPSALQAEYAGLLRRPHPLHLSVGHET